MTRLTKYIVAALLILFPAIAFSNGGPSVPLEINYQGFLADSGGAPVNDSIDITFSLYNDSIGSLQVWTETHTAVNVTGGGLRVILGSQNPLNIPFDHQYWLGIRVVGEPEEMSPLQPLTSVAYALKAGDADTVDGMDAADFLTTTGGALTGSLNVPSDGLTVGTDQLVVGGGKVGIGTATPEGNLHIAGSGQVGDSMPFVGMKISNDNSGWVGLLLENDNKNTWNLVVGGSQTPEDNDDLVIEYNDTAVMTLENNGNVGIGLTDPTSRLQVVSVNDYNYIDSIVDGDFDAGIHLTATSVGSESGAMNQYALFIQGTDNSGDFRINEDFVKGVWNPTTRLVLKNDTGDFGIGIANPANRMHLHATNDSAMSFTSTNTGITGNDGLYIGVTNTDQNGWVWNFENAKLAFGTNNLQRMTIDAGGNVGIGTAAPRATLDVNGFVKLQKNGSAPAGCDGDTDGSIALTAGYQLCVCKNGTGWLFTQGGNCDWNAPPP